MPPPYTPPPRGGIEIGDVKRVTPEGVVRRFAKFELAVTFVRLAGTQYFDPDPTTGGVDLKAAFVSPSGQSWQIPGYFDGTGWRFRFAPDREGTWTYTVSATDLSGTSEWTGGSFDCLGQFGRGWVHVDGRWFRHTDGTPFCPVGHNLGWQANIEQPPFAVLAADAPPGSAPRLVSFWLSQPWSLGNQSRALIEQTSKGRWLYEQTSCAYIDDLVERAEQAGVYLLPSVWIHDQLRSRLHGHPWPLGNWDVPANPYRDLDSDPTSFFRRSDNGIPTEQWRRQQAFLRYLIARWGSSPAISGWVALAEADGTDGWNLDPATVRSWAGAVGEWFRLNDPYRSGPGSSPVATSVTDTQPGGSSVVPGTPLPRAIDSYRAEGDDHAVASVVAREVLSDDSGSPVLITEFGGQVPRGATQPLHLHNGTWASWIAGAAMPALVWCDGDDYPLLDLPMRKHLAHLATFIGALDWVSNPDQVSAVAGLAGRNGDVRGWTRRSGPCGAAWLHRYRGESTLDHTELLVPTTNGTYGLRWYDTWAGTFSQEERQIVMAGTLHLRVPATDRPDIAACWRPLEAPTA